MSQGGRFNFQPTVKYGAQGSTGSFAQEVDELRSPFTALPNQKEILPKKRFVSGISLHGERFVSVSKTTFADYFRWVSSSFFALRLSARCGGGFVR